MNPTTDFYTFLTIFLSTLAIAATSYRFIPISRNVINSKNTILFSIIVFFALYYIGLTYLNYRDFLTGGDLPIFTELFENTIRGKFMLSTIQKGQYMFFSHHFSPILILIVPFFYILPSPYTLLTIQDIVFISSAWPLFHLTLNKTKNSFLAAAITIGYLLAPLQLEDLLTDFHLAYFTPAAVLFSLYFLHQKKTIPYFISISLLLICKTDAFIYAGSIGIYALFQKEHRKNGLITICLSVLYAVIALGLIRSRLSGGSDLLHHNWIKKRYGYLGNDFKSALIKIFTQPLAIAKDLINYNPIVKLKSLCFIFVPVLCIPLFSGTALVVLLAAIMVMFLSSCGIQNSLAYHYSSIIYAAAFFTTAIGSARLIKIFSQRTGNFIAIYILVAGLTTHVLFSEWTLGKKFSFIQYQDNAKIGDAYKIFTMIPDGRSVTCRENYSAHLIHNHPLAPIRTNSIYITLGAEYILLDERDRNSKDLLKILNADEYGVLYYDYMFILLKKGHPTYKNKEAVRQVWSVLEAEKMGQATGKNSIDHDAGNNIARVALKNTHNKDTLCYGPYQRYPEGHYTITFRLKTDNNSLTEDIAIIDVATDTGQKIFVKKHLKGIDFSAANKYQDFNLAFNHDKYLDRLEFRVYFLKKSDLWVDHIEVFSPALIEDNKNERKI